MTLKQIRLYRGLTQKEVAEKIGVDDSTLSAYENNNSICARAILEMLAKIYKCKVSDFYLPYEPKGTYQDDDE